MSSKKVPDGGMTTRKFKQIVSSIREIGLIELLSVIKPDLDAAGFLLLDANLRVLALKELGQDTAPCLIAKNFETYTYNHRISRLSTVQEHYMLRRAIDKGVSKERLARAFNLNLSTTNSRINLLHGICPKAVELLQDHQFTPDVTRHLRKMKAARQVEAVELMIAAKPSRRPMQTPSSRPRRRNSAPTTTRRGRNSRRAILWNRSSSLNAR